MHRLIVWVARVGAVSGAWACSGAPAAEGVSPESDVVVAEAEGVAAADSALRAELLAMGAEDQAVRAGITPESIQDTAFVGRMIRSDIALSTRLREIVATHGWPDAERVGREAVRAAFLIVQHTPFDDFREAMLTHVEADVRAGVLEGQDYALMVDRIRTHRGEPQLYGTQYDLVDGALVRDPVEDPADLDRRRAEVGLMPIAEYERILSEHYQAPIAPAAEPSATGDAP